MTDKLQILLVIGLLAILALIIFMVKKRSLELKYVLIWMICDIVLLVFAIFPHLMDSFSKLVGIYSPMNMIFFFGICFLLLICFSLTVALSRVTGRVRKIAQMLAMLQDEVKNECLMEDEK